MYIMATLKGSVLSILFGALTGAIIGLRPLMNVTLDMFVQQIDLVGGGVTFKHGNFREATIDKVCHTVAVTDNCYQSTADKNGTCLKINCSTNVNVDYPPVATFIEWNNFFSALLYFSGCICIIKKKDRTGVLLSILAFIEVLTFSNYILYATLVGSAVGFKLSDLTVPFICATVSAIFMTVILAFCSISNTVTDKTLPSKLVRVKYTKLKKQDKVFGLSLRQAPKQTTVCKQVTATLEDNVVRQDNALTKGNTELNDKTVLVDIVVVKDNALVEGNASVKDNIVAKDNKVIKHNSYVKENKAEKDNAVLENDAEVNDRISKIIYSLWTKDKMNVGIGKDAKGLNHEGIQVEQIRTVTNANLLERYNKKRNRIVTFAESVGGKLKGLNEYPGIIRKYVTAPSTLSLGCDRVEHSINEYFLFHGTQLLRAERIAEEGFNVDKSQRNMLGRGIYFSDSFVKADQYTVPDEKGTCCVIMAKVLLGDFVVTFNRKNIPSTASEPPCKKCLKTECKEKHKKKRPRFDSIVYTGGLFKEYVIFDNWKAYPEYIIYYKRV